MARGICPARKNRLPKGHGSEIGTSQETAIQTSASQGTTTANGSSQRTRPAAPPEVEPPKKRGRKPGKRTKLKPVPPSGQAIWLCQLQLQPPYRYTTQLGVILKREYPGLLQEKDEDGVLIRERPPDYFLGYGAVRAADVRAAAKENNVSRSNPVSMKVLAQQNAELRRENARLHKEKDSAMQQGKVAIDLTMALCRHLGLGQGIPEASSQLAAAAVAQAIATGSSRVGSESTNDDNADGHNEDNLNAVLETLNAHSGNYA